MGATACKTPPEFPPGGVAVDEARCGVRASDEVAGRDRASRAGVPPTIVCAAVVFRTSTVSAPSPPNSTIEPTSPPEKIESFSVPPLTVPVLPVCRTTVSLPNPR
jgi:hypothetical protein